MKIIRSALLRASAAACIIFLLALSVACTDEKPPAQTETTDAETTITPVTLPPFATETGANFRVIRPEYGTQTEIDAAVSIVKALADATEQMPDLSTDFIKPNSEYDSTSYEILVGRTAYPETQATLQELKLGEYAICTVGNKIIVTAWSDTALLLAADDFVEMLAGGMTTFSAENNRVETFNDMLNTLPHYTDGTLAALHNSGNRAYQMVTEKTTIEAWQTYCAALADAGFEKSSEREAAGNHFAVYRSARWGVTTYFTPFNKTARTIIEPIENMGDAADDPGAGAICTPQMTMIGRKHSENSTFRGVAANTGFMCFVIRLEDGRFLVIDGGTSSGNFAGTIWKTLSEQAPDPDHLTIAAWIITHSDSDHTGAFLDFCRSYSRYVNVESMLCNFPSESDEKAYQSSQYATSVCAQIIATYTSAYPDGQVIKLHNGHYCNIGGAQLEVLYTHEDLLTSSYSLAANTAHTWNKTSLIFRLTVAGETLMFLGDAQVENNNIVSSMYGSYLKSNIVQVAHHGGEGGTEQVYTLIDPAVALFTTSDELMEVYLKDRHNAHLVNELNLIEYINAADRITLFSLPYTPGTSTVIPG